MTIELLTRGPRPIAATYDEVCGLYCLAIPQDQEVELTDNNTLTGTGVFGLFTMKDTHPVRLVHVEAPLPGGLDKLPKLLSLDIGFKK